METPKRHPHVNLINAWANGAKIQVKVYRKQEAPTWVDIENPTWSEGDEYRIKPEADEPWKPEENERFFYVNQIGEVSNHLWTDGTKLCDFIRAYGNCFRTKAEAEAAAERMKAALKVPTDVSNNVGSNVGSELDGKPLTHIEKNAIRMFRAGVPFPEAECGTWRALSPGEDALIKALRAVKIADIYPYDAVIVYKEGDGELITDSYLVAFSLAITEGGRSALSESLSATCTALNKIQKEQEEAK